MKYTTVPCKLLATMHVHHTYAKPTTVTAYNVHTVQLMCFHLIVTIMLGVESVVNYRPFMYRQPKPQTHGHPLAFVY